MVTISFFAVAGIPTVPARLRIASAEQDRQAGSYPDSNRGVEILVARCSATIIVPYTVYPAKGGIHLCRISLLSIGEVSFIFTAWQMCMTQRPAAIT